jgi:hypothetical protein
MRHDFTRIDLPRLRLASHVVGRIATEALAPSCGIRSVRRGPSPAPGNRKYLHLHQVLPADNPALRHSIGISAVSLHLAMKAFCLPLAMKAFCLPPSPSLCRYDLEIS